LRRRWAGRSRGGKRKEGYGGGTHWWGRVVSKTKENKRSRGAWAAAGEKLGGLLGRRAGRGEGKFSLFFFSFSNSFQNNLLTQIQIKFLLNLSQNFIIFLRVTQATKNHAKPNNDAQPLVVSILIKLSLIF
jgi:hypothetical protein